MRTRSKYDYLRTGFLRKRIYSGDGSYETIDTPFRYRGAGSASIDRIGGSLQTSGQLMPGFMHTDTSNAIEAITPLDYAKGDKVILDDGSLYEVTQVNTIGFGEYGRLRNIRRSSATLVLS